MFKQTLSIIDWLTEVKTDAKVHEKTIELKSQILSMLDIIENLTKENKRLKEEYTKAVTNIEKLKKYKLAKLAPGIFVYIPKNKTEPHEESPWYCTNCYDNFQRLSLMTQDIDDLFTCPNCNNAFPFKRKNGPSLGTTGKSIASEFNNF